jgi:hypothetical protein
LFSHPFAATRFPQADRFPFLLWTVLTAVAVDTLVLDDHQFGSFLANNFSFPFPHTTAGYFCIDTPSYAKHGFRLRAETRVLSVAFSWSHRSLHPGCAPW